MPSQTPPQTALPLQAVRRSVRILRTRTVVVCPIPLLILLLTASVPGAAAASPPPRPNIILVLCDNLGYGDLECLGSTRHRTPHINRLAAEGLTLTSFYVSSGVCTPSRASLMTGCYPRRVNLHVPDNTARVLQPVSPKGLHPDEVTLAELLKSAGYATGIIGKWHLGDQPPFLPTRQGFDEYLGIPYSDDMTPREGRPWPPLPLMRGEQVVDAPVDRNLLTRRYTEAALDFIERQRHQPFFLFLSHAMPGSTAAPFASDAFRGRSANGPYGDSVEELDWSTGELLSGLERLNVAANTLILWTSDNGAPRRQPPQGSNAPWKGWGYDCSEGAMRMPCFVRWPGRVPAAAQSDALCTSMDLNPTFARLAGAELPSERLIDGRDIWPVWSGHPEASSPHEAFFYYFNGDLHAVRDARWKLYLPTPAAASNRRAPAILPPGELYDLRDDPAEQTNRATERTEVVARLNALAERCRADLGDGDRGGAGQRPAGWVDEPTPRILEP